MKKLFFLMIIMLPLALRAQYTPIICGPNVMPAANYVYLGSLNFPEDNSSNSQKLQVNIMGGGWGSNDKGVISFYIANRGGLSVNQVTTGGATFDGRSIRAYQNGYNTDFYLVINSSVTYYSFAVNAYLFGYATTNGPVTITTQTATPTGTDITSSLQVNPVQVTDKDGNIGLNTFSPDPAFKFSVNGKIRAKEIKVETGWADYVFDDDYRLPALSHVQSFIKQNHHLPEVPSAAEVKANGINLGEMNALLLKKVEELTLYLLEQQKEIQAQQKINRNLQTRMKALENYKSKPGKKINSYHK